MNIGPTHQCLPLPNKMRSMKVMSFDIEASSSHGDFPVADIQKINGGIIQHWTVNKKNISNNQWKRNLFIDLVLSAFGLKTKNKFMKI